MITCCNYMIPEQYHHHPRLAQVKVRFVQMSDDAVGCSDPATGTIYLRPDVPRATLHAAFRREIHNLFARWNDQGSLGDPPAHPGPYIPPEGNVIPFDREERHGVG